MPDCGAYERGAAPALPQYRDPEHVALQKCWIIVLLPSTACGGIRPTETADGGCLRLPTEEQYLIYNSPYRQATFMRGKIALTMTMRSLGLFQQEIALSFPADDASPR
jgi:hypothetical protein